jgi:hypothetical protein
VQPETASWLNESRGSFGAARSRFNDISSMDVTGAGALFMSAEYAVKAVIVEHYGFLPPSFETHRIINLSHRIGLWSQLPPALRTHLADIAQLDPSVRYPRETAYETLVSSSSNAEWQQRLTTGPRFIQYIERDVIGNPAAFGKRTFDSGAALTSRRVRRASWARIGVRPPRSYDANKLQRSARKRSHSTNTRTVPTPRTATFRTHRLTIAS